MVRQYISFILSHLNGAIWWGGKLGAEGHRNERLLAFSIFKINSWVWLPQVLVVPCGISVASWDSSVNRVPTLSCFETCGILVPRPGIEPASPALQSGFLTTGLPRKSQHLVFFFKQTGIIFITKKKKESFADGKPIENE